MDKQKIINHLIEILEQEYALLKQAALATYDAATNEESKPENQYDTRALEASYLAGAQAQRLEEVESLIFLLKGLTPRRFGPTDKIETTALVQLAMKSQKSWVFVLNKGGGIKMQWEGQSIQVVTPHSPLGEALMGLSVGDSAIVEDKQSDREYQILGLY